MRATTSSIASLLALALFSAQTSAFNVVLTNKCTKPIVLFDSRTTADIAAGTSLTRTIAPNSGAHVFRDSTNAQATRTSTFHSHSIDCVLWCTPESSSGF